ncbi:MAG: phosphoribosylglycinamide formyltransferase [Gammaproteobacteria bacterium]|nr:phosphoribosylglycinamide formyltransferase [Gammaproteobacteria bacterium]
MSLTRKQRICVLLSGSGTTFAAILDYQQRHQTHFEITHVVSDNPRAQGLDRARAHNIPTTVVPYKQFACRSDFDQELLDTVVACAPDLVVLAGFMRIVDSAFVARFFNKLMNIHPSLLPKYPGLNTYERVLSAGESRHGSSVHFVNNVLDGGPVIAQVVVLIDNNDSIATLSARVQEAERMLYPVVIDWFCDGRLTLQQGQAHLDGKPLVTPRIFHFDQHHGELHLESTKSSTG